MESLEISAKTVEEAIQRALEQLDVNRDEVEITVLKEGRSGILGLGAEEAVVRVKPLMPAPKEENEIAELAKGVLEKLLALMGVTASIIPQPPSPAEQGEEASVSIAFDVKGDDLGILIGRRGETLAYLQYIVRLIVSHQTEAWVPIAIDVEGYKQRRYQALQVFARQMAEQAKTRATPFKFEPMSAYERRIIHLALADYPGVITESIGEGEMRRVVILPRGK